MNFELLTVLHHIRPYGWCSHSGWDVASEKFKLKLSLDYESSLARYPALRKSLQIENSPVINLPSSLVM